MMTERLLHPPIQRPARWLKAMRTSDEGEESMPFVGYVDGAEPRGDHLNVTCSGPERLLAGRELPYAPPMVEEPGVSREAFEFHWRQLDYVFELPDPRTFAPLTTTLDGEAVSVLRRYIRTARDLAGSGVLNAVGDGQGTVVLVEDDTYAERLVVRLPDRDRQVGLVALLRHCDSPQENASFKRVADALWQACDREPRAASEARRDVLVAWRRAAGRLHGKSLNQLLRDKLVAEEEMGILAYDEPDSPAFLLSVFDYGDLLHWDSKREALSEWEQDKFVIADRRVAFLGAASTLAHVYIGFAVLAESALSGPANRAA